MNQEVWCDACREKMQLSGVDSVGRLDEVHYHYDCKICTKQVTVVVKIAE